MIFDLAVAGAALLPVALHAKALGVLSAALSPACLVQPSWWLCVGGVSLLYGARAWRRLSSRVRPDATPAAAQECTV